MTTIEFTPDEMAELVHLISVAVDGPEQGVCTFNTWCAKCHELVDFLEARGYHPHGQWTTTVPRR